MHNLYCQAHNFNIPPQDIILQYPLELIREIHISGGSWDEKSDGRKIRRDTHDSAVPVEVFNLLKYAMNKCSNLKFVVLEQLGEGLETAESRIDFQNDFFTMEKIVNAFNNSSGNNLKNNFTPTLSVFPLIPVSDEDLFNQQIILSTILEESTSTEEALNNLNNSILANSQWQIEKWNSEMVDTAMKIARKWKKG